MQYYACSSALRKEEQGGRGKEKACALVLTSAFKFSLKNLFSFLRLRGVVGVCARHFFCPASFLSDPLLGACALSFVTIKKLECL